MAFHGTYEHTLDAKNRLTMPVRWREDLRGRVLLVRSPNGGLSVFPEDTYNALAERSLADLDPLSAEGRRKRRRIFAFADPVDLDGAGRIVLRPQHLEHAGIAGRDVVISGAFESVDLWSRERWAEIAAEELEDD